MKHIRVQRLWQHAFLAATVVVGSWNVALLSSSVLPAAQAAARVKLSLYLYEGDTNTVDWVKKSIDQFEKANPGVQIDIITDSGSDYGAKLTTLWASGNPPDIWGQGGNVRTYVNQGWLLDLTRYVERDREELHPQEFFASAWKAYQWDGKIWGIPFMSVGSFIYYNVDLLEQAGVNPPPVEWSKTGWTWDDMLTAARKATVVGPDGKLKQAGLGVEPSVYGSQVYSYMWGGDWFDTDTYRTGTPTRSTLSTPANIQAYQAVMDIIWKHHYSPQTGEAWAWFFQGKVAMYMGNGPWTIMGQRSVLNFPWGLGAMPLAKTRATIVYTDAWLISSATKHPEEAWKFVKWLVSEPRLAAYIGLNDFPPARATVLGPYLSQLASFSRYHTPQQILQALVGAQEYGHEALDHIINGWDGISQRLTPIWNKMFANQISVPTALQQGDEALNKYYAQLAARRQ
ncbi:MAG: sugar ABC transporter substrate-binding protein [Limnochordaceae bacterium]|nr:sugar ABC transporter substrate-binding protein [Limnochordaceae bacterium]